MVESASSSAWHRADASWTICPLSMVAPQKKKPRRFLRLQGSFSAIWVSVLRRLSQPFQATLICRKLRRPSKHSHRKSFQSNFADLLGIRGPETARQAATGGCYRVLPRTSRADGDPATCSMVLVCQYPIRKAIGLKRRKVHPGNVSHLKFTTVTKGVSASPATVEGKGDIHWPSRSARAKNWPEHRF